MTNVKATVNWLIIVQSLADLMPAANFATQQMEKKQTVEVVLLRKNFQEIWLSLFSKETKVHVFQPESFSSDKLSDF